MCIRDSYPGVHHRRTVVIVEQGVVLVTDSLTSQTPHDYDQTWHVFPGAGLDLDGLDATVDNVLGAPLVLVRQAGPDGLSLQHAHGGIEPMQGWVSGAYGKKEPSHTLEYRRHGNDASFATLFAIGRRARSTTPAYLEDARDLATGDRIVRIFADGVQKTVRIANEGTSSATVAVAATN